MVIKNAVMVNFLDKVQHVLFYKYWSRLRQIVFTGWLWEDLREQPENCLSFPHTQQQSDLFRIYM